MSQSIPGEKKKIYKGESLFGGTEETEKVKPLSALFLLYDTDAKLSNSRMQPPLLPPPRSMTPFQFLVFENSQQKQDWLGSVIALMDPVKHSSIFLLFVCT